MEIKLKDVLRRELKIRHLTIQTLAERCLIPKATLHGWSQGVLPSAKNIHHLKSLSDYLGLTLDSLLFNVKSEHTKDSILFSTTFIDQDKRYRLVIEKLPK